MSKAFREPHKSVIPPAGKIVVDLVEVRPYSGDEWSGAQVVVRGNWNFWTPDHLTEAFAWSVLGAALPQIRAMLKLAPHAWSFANVSSFEAYGEDIYFLIAERA